MLVEYKKLDNEWKATRQIVANVDEEIQTKGFAVASTDEQDQGLLISGGEDSKGEASDKTFIFNIVTKKMVRFSPLSVARSYHSSIRSGKRVFVFWGKDGSKMIDSIEEVDEVKLEYGLFERLPRWLSPAATYTGCFKSLVMLISPTEILVAGGQTDDEGNMTSKAFIMESQNFETVAEF